MCLIESDNVQLAYYAVGLLPLLLLIAVMAGGGIVWLNVARKRPYI